MHREQWEQIETLFSEVRDLPAHERAAALRDRCTDDAIRSEVASLLAVYEDATGFFRDLPDAVVAPALCSFEPSEDAPPSGDPLGLEGTLVRRYEVEQHIGGGGMGVVYRAYDPHLDRNVALKFLPSYLTASQEAEERLVQEAQAAARLDHPHIATVHEIGETESGHRYIAMAYYQGETLRERLAREGPLATHMVIECAEMIAEALTEAHEAGIVHRDVKPGNVMLTEEGGIKLLDFGLARALDQPRLTEPGRPLGTASYMSPEQIRGEGVGPGADVWALGAVIFEMLTGERPFQGKRRAAVLQSVLHDGPTNAVKQRDGVPRDLCVIIRRCLRKDLGARYSSAQALLDDLQSLRADTASLAPETRALDRRSRWRGWERWGLTAVGLILVTIGLMWIPWLEEHAVTSEATPSLPAIAVLPFESPAENPPEVSPGLNRDLANRLSRASDVRVISESSVHSIHSTDKTTTEIAQTLNARWILTGTVKQPNDKIRVRAQLIDTRRDTTVWSKRYRQSLRAGDLFALQSTIARRVLQSLDATLTPHEERRVEWQPTESLDAYRLYVQGRTHLDQRTQTGLRQSVAYFREALDTDSSFARAWSGLADAALLSRKYGHAVPGLNGITAEEAARQAIAIDSSLAQAHASLGRVLYSRQRGPAALRTLHRATRLNDSYAQAYHWLATVEVHLGRLDSALVHMKRAVELDPLAPINHLGLAACHYFHGDSNEALAHARRTVELAPRLGTGYLATAYLLSIKGRHQAAIDTVKEGHSLLPRTSIYRKVLAGWPGVVYARAGDTTEALNSIEAISPGPARALQRALVYQALGRSDASTSALRETEPSQWTWVNAGMFQYGRLMASLQEQPVYRTVRTRLRKSMGGPTSGDPSQ